MEDLLQSQIRDSCRLGLPEGLRDLMSDISREVLRAQPPDLYDFIVSYLEAMLLARDTLCVACRVCRDVCQCACHPELEEELRNLGLGEEDLETVKNVVMEYFDKGNVKEENLLMKLLNKTEIDVELLPAIQHAVREAFQKHLQVQQTKYWTEADEVGHGAAKHTLQYYDRVEEDKELSWHEAATTVQAAFLGDFIRVPIHESSLKLREKLAQIECTRTMVPPKVNIPKDEPEKASTSRPVRNNIVRLSLSSSSLAGSLINLPKYVPYSVHDMTYVDFEERETERKNIDYTLDTHYRDTIKEEGTKKIVFYEQHVLHEIKSCSIEDESDIEEQVVEDIQTEVPFDNEHINDDKSVDDIDEEIESSFDENTCDENIFIEDIEQLVSFDVKNIDHIEFTAYKPPVGKIFAGDSTVDAVVEEIVQLNENLSDHLENKGELKSTSFDDQVHEQKYLEDMIEDDYVEEEIEEEDGLDMKMNLPN